jgi:DGQHR domain-containing protein
MGQKEVITVDAIKIVQNEDMPFYIFKMTAEDLLAISYFEPRELDRETGIQRNYNESRGKEIAEYIDSENSVLANNIIVSLKKECVEFKDGKLAMKRVKGAAFVIDGQHRLRAFTHVEKKDFELPVSAFVNLSLPDIAEIFVKINYYQKPVNKSLVYDLLGISGRIFPEFIESHKVTRVLNETVGSPWYGQIKMLGIGRGIITQATFINAMSSNKVLDKILKGIDTDTKIVILSSYFLAIKSLFPEQWCSKDSIISKSLGVHSFMKLFSFVFDSVAGKNDSFKVKDVWKFLTPLQEIDFQDSTIATLGGMKGVKNLSKIMGRKLGVAL